MDGKLKYIIVTFEFDNFTVVLVLGIYGVLGTYGVPKGKGSNSQTIQKIYINIWRKTKCQELFCG